MVPLPRRFLTLVLLLIVTVVSNTAALATRQHPLPPPPFPANDAADSWSDDAVCYEVFVRSFADSDGDGIGDLRGLIDRLDYVNDGDPATDTDLGATCV